MDFKEIGEKKLTELSAEENTAFEDAIKSLSDPQKNRLFLALLFDETIKEAIDKVNQCEN